MAFTITVSSQYRPIGYESVEHVNHYRHKAWCPRWWLTTYRTNLGKNSPVSAATIWSIVPHAGRFGRYPRSPTADPGIPTPKSRLSPILSFGQFQCRVLLSGARACTLRYAPRLLRMPESNAATSSILALISQKHQAIRSVFGLGSTSSHV